MQWKCRNINVSDLSLSATTLKESQLQGSVLRMFLSNVNFFLQKTLRFIAVSSFYIIADYQKILQLYCISLM